MNAVAPIALFTYNRLTHTRRTVAALQKNELAAESDLWIYSDGPKDEADTARVQEVRNFLGTVEGFKSVRLVKRPQNLGLARSIITGVTQLCEQFGRVIVLEDDLVTTPFFLRYLNDGLELYENQPEVISIHGYVYPIKEPLPETFFIKGADCWGWGTWQRGWKLFNPDGASLLAQLQARKLTAEFDFAKTAGYTAMLRDQIEGRNNSWAIRWYASAFLQDKLTLYPGRPLVCNIGNDGTGTHSDDSKAFDVELASQPPKLEKLVPRENLPARRAFENHFRRPPRLQRLKKKVMRLPGKLKQLLYRHD